MVATDSMQASSEPADSDVGPALVISSSTLMSFVVITTVLRLLVRARNRMIGWDDLTIACVAVLSAARLGCQIAQVRHGDGRHREYIDSDDYITASRLGWYALLLFFVAVCLMKISICLLLLRIKNEKWLRWLIYGVMAGLVVTNGGVVVILLAECRPVDQYWDDVGSCWDPRVRIFSTYLTIAYQILTDLLCSCLPLVVIWKVRIPLKSKLLVCGLMSLGLLATGCGIGRAVSLTLATDDITWAYCITEIWANCELFVGTIAANLALSRSIYIYFFEDDTHLQGGSGGGANGGHTGALINSGVGSGPNNGPSSRSVHRVSLYCYQTHGLSFLNNLHMPWSWKNRQYRRETDRHHVFRRQSSYSPSRNSTVLVCNNSSSSSGSESRTATMETATATFHGSPQVSKGSALVRRLSSPLRRIFSLWKNRSTARTPAPSTAGVATAMSSEKGKNMSSTMVGVSPVRSRDGSVAMIDGVVVPNESGGRRGSVSSAVVITSGRGRALDRDRERGHARNGRSISSSTTVTSRRRSSLYYHHHLSKQHPYGNGGVAKPWSAATATAEAASASNDSGLPAGAGVIKKRTEFWISEEELDRDDYDDGDEEYDEEVDHTEKTSRKNEEETVRLNSESSSGAAGKGKATADELAFAFATSPEMASSSGRQSISDASTTTAVDVGLDVDGSSSNSGSSIDHNNGSEEDLELGLHPPPRAHLS